MTKTIPHSYIFPFIYRAPEKSASEPAFHAYKLLKLLTLLVVVADVEVDEVIEVVIEVVGEVVGEVVVGGGPCRSPRRVGCRGGIGILLWVVVEVDC